jgi:hypothetical protein
VVERQEIPERPSEKECLVEDELWPMLVSCWRIDPATRPSASQAIRKLVGITHSLNSQSRSAFAVGKLQTPYLRMSRDLVHDFNSPIAM